MPEAERTIEIQRPPAEVFAFLADAENDRKWRDGIVDIRRQGGGDVGVGTRYRQRMKGPLGRRIPASIEITAYEPERLIAFHALEGPVRPEGRYELSPSDGGTRLLFALRAETGGLKKLMAPMVRRTMEREVGRLEQLKTVLESQPSGAPPNPQE